MNVTKREEAFKLGIVKSKIVRVLHTATILRAGWEMDNQGWVVKLESGKVVGLTTDHGTVCLWPEKEMIQIWKATQDAADEVNACIQLINQGKK